MTEKSTEVSAKIGPPWSLRGRMALRGCLLVCAICASGSVMAEDEESHSPQSIESVSSSARHDLIEALETIDARDSRRLSLLRLPQERSIEPEIFAVKRGYPLESGELSLVEESQRAKRRRWALGGSVGGAGVLYFLAATSISQDSLVHLQLSGALAIGGIGLAVMPSATQRSADVYFRSHEDRVKPSVEETLVDPLIDPPLGQDSARLYRAQLRALDLLKPTDLPMYGGSPQNLARAESRYIVAYWEAYLSRYPDTVFRERIEERISSSQS